MGLLVSNENPNGQASGSLSRNCWLIGFERASGSGQPWSDGHQVGTCIGVAPNSRREECTVIINQSSSQILGCC